MLVPRLFVLNLRVVACMFDVEFPMLRRVVVHSPNYSYRNSSNYGFLSGFQAGFEFLGLPLSDGICRLVYALSVVRKPMCKPCNIKARDSY
jgi:hypothetical protein